MLAENHIHSQWEAPAFGEGNCEGKSSRDATKGFLKITGPPPSLSKRTHTDGVGVGAGTGKALLTWAFTPH